MTLTNFIERLKEETTKEKLLKEAEETVVNKIKLPADFKNHVSKMVEVSNRYGEYHLELSAFPQRDLDRIQPLLDETISKAKSLSLGHMGHFQYRVLWTPEGFQRERKLTGLLLGEVDVRSSVHTCDPTKLRIGYNGHDHEIKAELAINKMVVSASGLYQAKLEELVRISNPQSAMLNLSKADAERILRKAKEHKLGKYLGWALKRALHPQKRQFVSISAAGVDLKEQDVIELKMPASSIRAYEQILGKSLFALDQETRVSSLVKTYGIRGLFGAERLRDLQAIAREIPGMNLGVIYNHPVITDKEAKEIVEGEIKLLNEGYKDSFMFRQSFYEARIPALKRLGQEHFGDKVLEGFDDLPVNDYVAILRGMGYVEKDVGEKDKWKIDPKERHLLQFLNESYAQDPKGSIEGARQSYTNKGPNIKITAGSNKKPVSKLRKLELPSQSRLINFSIDEHVSGKRYNDLSINIHPGSDYSQFFMRASAVTPVFLALQDYACQQAGIEFN